MILTKAKLNELVKGSINDKTLQKTKVAEKSNYDIFISYSWNDRFFAYKVVKLLERCGYSVYIDFSDKRLDRNNVNVQTAERLFEIMTKCRGLLYIYSPSSKVSEWCAWEIGLFSGKKNFKCANLPIIESGEDIYKKHEYLKLYFYIDYDTIAGKNTYEFWVCENEQKYVSLKEWLNHGTQPSQH